MTDGARIVGWFRVSIPDKFGGTADGCRSRSWRQSRGDVLLRVTELVGGRRRVDVVPSSGDCGCLEFRLGDEVAGALGAFPSPEATEKLVSKLDSWNNGGATVDDARAVMAEVTLVPENGAEK